MGRRIWHDQVFFNVQFYTTCAVVNLCCAVLKETLCSYFYHYFREGNDKKKDYGNGNNVNSNLQASKFKIAHPLGSNMLLPQGAIRFRKMLLCTVEVILSKFT